MPMSTIAKRFEYPYAFVLIASDCIERGEPMHMPPKLRAAIHNAMLFERERRRQVCFALSRIL
jgi:hypothetical protein